MACLYVLSGYQLLCVHKDVRKKRGKTEKDPKNITNKQKLGGMLIAKLGGYSATAHTSPQGLKTRAAWTHE